jgi:hypothetical protein
MLISETHFTEKSYLKLLNYTVYDTNHPAGTAIIVKKLNTSNEWLLLLPPPSNYCIGGRLSRFLNHFGCLSSTQTHRETRAASNFLQHPWAAVTITPSTPHGDPVSLCPEDEKSTKRWNIHTYAISLRANPPTGPLTEINCATFCVTKGIPPNSAAATSNLDLSSDHSPVIVDLTTHAVLPEHPPRLSTQRTNWDFFRLITERLTLNISLKSTEDMEEAVKLFNDTIQWAGWTATPNSTAPLHTHQT